MVELSGNYNTVRTTLFLKKKKEKKIVTFLYNKQFLNVRAH